MRCHKRVHIVPNPQKIKGKKLSSGNYEYTDKVWTHCLCGEVKND